MERNPLIVVSSRIDQADTGGRGGCSNGASPAIVAAWRRAREADIGNTIVDCHDDAIAGQMRDEGAYCVETDLTEIPPTHNYKPPSGLARIARSVTKFDRFCNHDLIVHLPEHYAGIDAKYLRALMYPLAASDVGMATLAGPPVVADEAEDSPKLAVAWNPDRKVYVMPEARVGTVTDFSRRHATLGEGEGDIHTHIPVCIYRRATLDRIVRMPPSARELAEDIEALRVLALGTRVEALYVPEGVPADMHDTKARYD